MRNKVIKLIIIYMVITGLISSVGYFLWLGKQKFEVAAFIPILAPTIAALIIRRLSNNEISLNILRINLKGIGIGVLLCVLCYGLAITIFLVSGQSVIRPDINISDIILLIVQWIFAGFCEELGWRGVLLPLLKKILSLEKASLVTGLIWSLWHLPLILTCNMSKGHSYIGGYVLFTISVIALSLIFGIFSEFNIGKSVWTYVSVHALYNVIGVIIMKMITIDKYRYLDESGYFLVISVIFIATVTYFVNLKLKCNHNTKRKEKCDV